MKIPQLCSNISCKEESIGLFWIYTKSFPNDNGKTYTSLVALCQKDFDKQNKPNGIDKVEKLKRGVKIQLKNTESNLRSSEVIHE